METVQTKNCVLDSEAVSRKLKRMAYEVAERNSDEKELVIAGIAGNGEIVAHNLVKELQQIADFTISEVRIQLNKKDPIAVAFQPDTDLENRVFILVDDVANTGRTLMYALKPLLDARPKKVQTLVLVERSHKQFPVQTDYAGLSIATTLQEHITVETKENTITGAWLF